MTAVSIAIQNPAANESWSFEGGASWFKPGEHEPAPSVREVARAMNALGARFITITAYQLPGDTGFRLEYHWDLEGRLLGFTFNIAGDGEQAAGIDSIFDLCEAVDWIEREVHEGFGIEFSGREYEPLLLREGDTPGVNLRDAPQSRPVAPPQQEVRQ